MPEISFFIISISFCLASSAVLLAVAVTLADESLETACCKSLARFKYWSKSVCFFCKVSTVLCASSDFSKECMAALSFAPNSNRSLLLCSNLPLISVNALLELTTESNIGFIFWALEASCNCSFLLSICSLDNLCCSNSLLLLSKSSNFFSSCLASSTAFSKSETALLAVVFSLSASAKSGLINSIVELTSSSVFTSAPSRIPLILFLCSSTAFLISAA